MVDKGWGQISIYSDEVFEKSTNLPGRTKLVPDVLANETDPFFSWQFNPQYSCPKGCVRTGEDKSCQEVEREFDRELRR